MKTAWKILQLALSVTYLILAICVAFFSYVPPTQTIAIAAFLGVAHALRDGA
jgi:hypothetical protein